LEIPAYAPVALAGLGWLPDTILSRSVIIRMRRRSQGEKVEQFRRRIHERQSHQVRALIQQWAQEAEIAWPELPPEIQDRDADVWEPLIAIADAVGSEWPTRARVAAVTLVAASKEVDPSLGIRLLADLRTIFSDREQMTTKEVLQALNNLDESPWGDLKGKPLDERSLPRRLKQYGIKSKNLNLGGYDRPKGYHRDDLYDAWNRYLPSPPSSETTATSATGATEPGSWAEKVADVADSSEKVADALLKNGNGMSEVAEVADVADLSAHAGRVCAQCGAGPSTTPRGDLSTYQVGGIWLLGSCRRFWSLRA
jgi:hypothetical protein